MKIIIFNKNRCRKGAIILTQNAPLTRPHSDADFTDILTSGTNPRSLSLKLSAMNTE